LVSNMTASTSTELVRPNRFTLLDDPYNQPDEGHFMQFRLTYEGPLFATQRDPISGQQDKRGVHKHDIRRAFHAQLKRLWDVVPHLKTGVGGGSAAVTFGLPQSPPRDVAFLSARHSLWNWNFVPLVTQDLNLVCGLDILFLRPDRPGAVLQSGDIDNRLLPR